MKEKNYNLEAVRMVSFILVIAIHVTNYFCRAYGRITQGEYLFALFLDTAARVSVPAFFMISGALLLGREEPVRKHVQRLLRFAGVLIVWSAVYYFWNIYYMGTPYDLRNILYEPTEAHLWYLYAMIPIYLVLPFFQILCRGMDIKMERIFLLITTVAVAGNYGMWLIGEEAYYDLPLIGDRIYAYYIFLGYYLYKYRKHIRLSQHMLLTAAIISMAAAFFTTLIVTEITGRHYEGALTYACPFIALMSASFFLFMIRLHACNIKPGEQVRKVMDLFCGCSFGIYLIHILFLDTYKKYVEAWEISAWIAIPGLIILITLVSFVCVFAMRRFKIGRKIT